MDIFFEMVYFSSFMIHNKTLTLSNPIKVYTNGNVIHSRMIFDIFRGGICIGKTAIKRKSETYI